MSMESLFHDDSSEVEEQAQAELEAENAEETTEEKPSEQEEEKSAEVQEGDSEGATEGDREEKAPERVPLASLLDERRQRQQAEGELRELRENFARLDERLNHIQQATQKEEAPSKDEDPVAYLEHENRKLQERLKPLEEGQTNQREYAEYQQAVNEVQSRTQAYETQFAAEHPDYHDAVDFIQKRQIEHYKIMGVTDPMHMNQMLQRDALTMANNAMANGQNPAEVAYNLAKFHGFAQPAPQNKLENVAKGQEKSSSLSKVGGNESIGLTMDTVENLDDETFERITDAQWRKLAAGGTISID